MHSVSPHIHRAVLLAICGLLVVAISGCTTTQETAARKQAQSKRILEKREQKAKSDHQGSQQR